MVQAQGIYASAGASAQVSVTGDPPLNYPLIIGGIALLGIIVAAVVLKK